MIMDDEKEGSIVHEQACQLVTAHYLSCNSFALRFGCYRYSCLEAVGDNHIEIFGITLFGIFVTLWKAY
jgi:hypothetical protein